MADKWFLEPTSADQGGIFEFFRYINNATDQLFFPVIILVIWIIAFINMLFSGNIYRPGAVKAWIFTNFFCGILLTILAVANLISRKYVYISIILLGIGVLWMILESSRD